MTFESRAKHAAAAIHGAVALVEPRLPVRPRRRGWRALIVVALTALTPPGGAVVWNSLGEDPAPPRLVIDPPREPEERVHDDLSVAPPASAPSEVAAASPLDAGNAPSDNPTPQQSAPATSLPTTHDFSQVACDPVLLDAKGDIDDPALDILAASIAYDAATRTLKVRQVFADLPESHLPREALAYFFSFDVDGMTYHALSYIGAASYMQWYFAVQRDDRTTNQWPEGRRTILYATGAADHVADTVTLEFNIDDFNRGERTVAAEEGLAPAAELRSGSTLRNISMTAYARSAGPGTQDQASGCNFILEDA